MRHREGSPAAWLTSASALTSARALVIASALASTGLAAAAAAAPGEPIKIGVIAEASAISGAGITQGARLAVDAVNAAGGVGGRKLEMVEYDDHGSAADGVRAFQRAVSQDQVVAVIGVYISEIALALQPWAARLHVPFITTGAASNEISRHVHDDYERNRYTFHEFLASSFIADAVCDSLQHTFVPRFGVKSAVVLSEDAAWSTPLDAEYLACLPKAGLKVLDHIRFSADTADFTPLFNKIEGEKPDIIVTGISHVGVQPTVQWFQQQVPIPLFGYSGQATSGTFWKDTNGAAAGVVTFSLAAEGSDATPQTQPFIDAYKRRFGGAPVHTAFTTFDAVHILAQAIRRVGGTDGDKLVAALEQTDFAGTVGRVQFYGRDSEYTHAMRYGRDFVSGVMLQWQGGAQVVLWPQAAPRSQAVFPPFVHLQPK